MGTNKITEPIGLTCSLNLYIRLELYEQKVFFNNFKKFGKSQFVHKLW